MQTSILRSLLMVLLLFNMANAYTVHIDAPAVLSNVDRGVLTSISLNVTSGTGQVSIGAGGQSTIAQDTQMSAQEAANYASNYLGLNENSYNFNYTISGNNVNISGPSAGLAMTLLAIAGLEHKQLVPDFTVTGTINPNGSVGQIGGVFDKVQAAKSINARFILVPYLNPSDYQYLLYYLSQQNYNVPVIEVANVSQAVPYALGYPGAQITELNFTLYKNYYPDGLQQINSSCSSCNNSAFEQLVNATFNFTQDNINNINTSKFSGIKLQMQQQLSQYKEIASKGYLYSAADLAFNEYPVTYLFSNYGQANYTNAQSILDNISAYCGSVGTPPQLTDRNYEYVIGGEARMTWANITLSLAYNELNQSQTSDDILALLQSVAPAYSWCLAASQMYGIASNVGGSPVTLPQSAESYAYSKIQKIDAYGTDLLYVNASRQAYGEGEYGAALYSAAYADVFYNATSFVNQSSSTLNSSVSSALSSANGIWPEQYAFQARFYSYEASISNSTSAAQEYINNAYTTAKLSQDLDGLNTYLSENFVAGSSQPQPYSNPGGTMEVNSTQITRMEQNIQLIFGLLVLIIIILLITLAILLNHLLNKPKPKVRRGS